jgi:hypothetical protein
MSRYVGVFVFALILGVYLGASFSDHIGAGLQRVHVPLLGHHQTSQ